MSPVHFDHNVRKLIFLARSFGRHALELGNEIPEKPLYFLKAPSSVIPEGLPVILPRECESVHFEAEVAVVIGETLKGASPEEAERAIIAWTVLNDVTARSVQRQEGGRFTRAKGYDTFCPIASTWLESLDWKQARIQGWLNGVCVQDAPLTDMLFSPGEAIASISSVMTINPGDLISLGTPEGVGPLSDGDHFEIRLCHDGDGVNDAGMHRVLLSFSHEVRAEGVD